MKKIFIFAVALATLGLTSCDIDDVKNVGEMSTSEFPKTDADAEAILAGVYQNLNTINANPQMSFLYNAALASDDQLGGGGTNDKLMQAEDLLCNYNADMTNQFYADRYAGIARANNTIKYLGLSSNMSEDTKNQAIGEAKALRAYYYYELASMYGNVPLVTDPDADSSSQGDVKVLWGQILQDLYEAYTAMPDVKKDNGRLDKYTVAAMLGRVWLFYTGFYCNGTTTADLVSTNYSPLTSVELPNGTTLTKEDVVKAIDDCVNNSGYELVPDFRNLWAYSNSKVAKDYPYAKDNNLKWVENDNAVNPETMFAIKFNKFASWSTTIGYANGYALHFGVRGTACFPFGAGWGAGPVAPNLVSDWKAAEPTDMRMNATIQNMQDLQGFALGGGGDFLQESGYYDKKLSPVEAKKDDGTVSVCFENLMYPDNWSVAGAENLQLNNIHDLVLMRFAEVLLMQSELTENADGMNKVRARAGLPAVSYSLQALQNERRFELAFEGLRWNDIRRWHIAAAALDKQTGTKIYNKGIETTNTRSGFSYSARYNATAGFQKKPENQVSLSEGGIQQNPGWEDASSMYTKW